MFPMKNGFNITYFLYTDTQKFSNTFPPITDGVKFLKFIATYLYCTKYNEIKYFIQLYKSMLCIQITQKISEIL